MAKADARKTARDAVKRLRGDIVETARAMNRLGVNQGASGNVSVRIPDGDADGSGLLLTPSGLDYDLMTPRDIVSMAWDGASKARKGRKPTSEWRFHRDILKARPEFNAVVHAHPVAATAIACHGRGIGPFHYMVAVGGGRDIRCAPYKTFGSEALSTAALDALEDRTACLLAHHGVIACGRDLPQALGVMVEVETLAKQYLAALAIGEPTELPDDEMDVIIGKFRDGYGLGLPKA